MFYAFPTGLALAMLYYERAGYPITTRPLMKGTVTTEQFSLQRSPCPAVPFGPGLPLTQKLLSLRTNTV